MTGLLELIGIICLFGLAPVCAWKWWAHLEELDRMQARGDTESAVDAELAVDAPAAPPALYDQQAS